MKARLALVLVCCLALAACSSMHAPHIWPFYKKPKPAPEAVHELDIVNADGSPAAFPQYWKRNTLVIDLSGVSGTGSVAAKLPEQTTWPVRLAVRVRPGSVEQLEIQGEERNVLPVSREGVDPIDLELAPSVFRRNTAAIYINWGYMPQFGEVVVEPESSFHSPMEVPKAAPAPPPANEPAAEPSSPSASEIIPPAEAAPPPPATQASPPPGS